MNEQKKVQFGEIYLFDFGSHEGSVQNGLRPALIVQENRMNAHSPTTLVAAITTVTKKTYLPSHIILGDDFGLERPSMVLLEQIACVNQNNLQKYIGVVDSMEVQKQIRNGIKKVFGMWNYNPRESADVRCLCPRCLKDYIESGKYIVRRLDPFCSEKSVCDKCDSSGYDYVVVERKCQACKPKIRTFETVKANE